MLSRAAEGVCKAAWIRILIGMPDQAAATLHRFPPLPASCVALFHAGWGEEATTDQADARNKSTPNKRPKGQAWCGGE